MQKLFFAFLCLFVFSFNALAEEVAPSDAALIYNGVLADEQSGGKYTNGLNELMTATVNNYQNSLGKIGELLKKELERASVSFCAKFLNLKGSKSENLAAAYCYGVKPAAFRNQNYFQRTDRYMVDGSTGDLLQVTKGITNFGMQFDSYSDIQFIRHFTDVFKAYGALPYLPSKLPLKAENIQKLQVNDYASFITDMNILWDVSPTWKKGAMEIGASVYYIVSGSFQVNVYKLNNTHIKMKVVGLRGNEAGANVHLGFNKDLKIFGVKVVDKQVNRIFDATELLYAGASKSKNTTFVAEYTIDTSDPTATAAYDAVMKSSWKTQTLHAASELGKALKEIPGMLKWFTKGNNTKGDFSDELGGSFLSVVDPLDKVFKDDQQYHPTGTSPRVARKFQGLVNTDSRSSEYQIGLTRYVYSLIGSEAFYENAIELEDAESNKQYYLLDVSKEIFAKRVLFTLRDTSESSDIHALYKTDSTMSVKMFEGLGLTYEYRDKNMSSKKQKEVYQKLEKLLPPPALGMLNFSNWDLNTDKSNARIYEQIIFRSNALNVMAKNFSKPAQIKALIMSMLQEAASKGNLPNLRIKNSQNVYGTQVADYENDAEEIAIRLVKAISDYKGDDRRTAFKALSTELPLFKEVGVPLMLKMLPPGEMEQLVYIDVSWSADGHFAGLTKPYGSMPQGNIYDAMKYVMSLLMKMGFDLNTYLGENDLAKDN